MPSRFNNRKRAEETNILSTLLSAFSESDWSALTSWSKLEDNMKLSQLQSKFWGKSIEEEAKKWHRSHPTMKVDHTNDIGEECFGLDLGIEVRNCRLWVQQDYIRIYDFCVKQHEEGLLLLAVIITGQLGVGVFLSLSSLLDTLITTCVKRKNILDHLWHLSLSWQRAAFSLAQSWQLLFICWGWSVWRRHWESWCQCICTISTVVISKMSSALKNCLKCLFYL